MEIAYYDAHDIARLTKYSVSNSYAIIRKLNAELKIKYPNIAIYKGRILADFFNEKIGRKELMKSEKNY